MTIGNWFWVTMVVWFLLSLWSGWPPRAGANGSGGWASYFGHLLLLLSLFLLGWKVFGFVVHP